VHQVGFYYTDVSRCTVNNTWNSPTCFGATFTIVRKNYYVIYFKPDIALKLSNMVSIAVTSQM